MSIELENLSQKTLDLWAKKKTVEGKQLWLPLLAHLIDTEKTINFLFNTWLSSGTKKFLTTSMSEEKLQKLVKFLGFFHDVGKSIPAFQVKPSFDGGKELDGALVEKLIRDGFSNLDEDKEKILLSDYKKSPHALAGAELLKIHKVPKSVRSIIAGHHGDAGNETNYSQIEEFTSNYLQNDNDLGVQKNWKEVQNQLFDYGMSRIGYQAVTDIPTVTQPQAVILEGLLITADWLASSEFLGYDQTKPLFSLISIDESLNDIDLESRFESAMNTWDLGGHWYPPKVQSDADLYERRWGFKPRPVQAALIDAVSEAKDLGMMIIEAPTGVGKTEMALLSTEQLAYKTQHPGLFIGLPTQATSNAMFDRVQDWLNELAKDQDEHFPIKLMHGKAQFNESFKDLPNASNVDDSGGVVVNDWFSGKKSILSKFVVGTIDNLLLMGLKQKHLFLRHLGFSEKVVVIDEVHAYDSYMNQYLYKAIEWLGVYHVPIIILSATLPKQKRKDLINAYYHGKYGKKMKALKTSYDLLPDWVKTQAYPLVTMLDGDQVEQISKFPGVSDQKPLQIQVTRINEDDSTLIETVLNSIKDGGIAGVIVNTVGRAQELANLVPKEIKLMVLHSAFLAPDRAAKETELQNAIGKNGKRPDKMIIIGTQVLEQSLDIDFDILFTDIAPMDLILQRAGRLHRHNISRPEALQIPRLYIMGIESMGEYEDGSETVYGKYLLMKTDYFLKETIEEPKDVSNLVQAVYDDQLDPQIKGIEKAKAKFEQNLAKEKVKARAFQIADPKSDAHHTLYKWLNRSTSDVSGSDQKAAAAVRDIKESLEVILLQHTNNGIFLLDGRSIEDCQSREVAEQLIRLPSGRTQPINTYIELLEKFTAKKFPGWQQDKWLKGALALTVDENFCGYLGDNQFNYSSIYGLHFKEEDDDVKKTV
ncbi:CRISPR-associated helicase Cas3' [Secundilactobacillus silagei]|uniref:CRISPR-associated helicase cas3 n=1 Tax=Secundilactobacillus silagei JCM 19001 TaxID=1302250 RepID=A0A1Z5H3T7_9LACO|nr:CRISPR-associated helicase Cas3' [Secundilactobacillus silagei]TDG70270.1 hypothetical protein C5L25_001460 [Secundilactobacillus silagei JCM 19001]GAT17958.1 CRISPR-associated helicase cas3 [Secundilactobacillus silagei JCM 19001]